MELEGSSPQIMDWSLQSVCCCLMFVQLSKKGKGECRSTTQSTITKNQLCVLRIQGWDGRATSSTHQAQLSRQAQSNAVFFPVHGTCYGCYGCLPQKLKEQRTTESLLCFVIVKP